MIGEGDGSDDGEVGDDDAFISREFETEAKTFACGRSNGVYIIHERHKRWERKLLVSKNQLLWIGEILLIRSKSVGVLKGKEGKYIDEEMIIAVEGSNSWGSFISFQVGRGRSIQNFVVFPAGKEGCEWFRASQWIQACTSLVGQANSGVLGSAPAVTKNQQRSFVDVARSFPANPCHSYSLQGLEKKLTELESNFNELSLKLDKVLHEMCHLRNLAAPLGEEGSDTSSSVISTNVSLGNNGGHESIVIDKMVIDLHFALGDNSKCWGSMLSVEELRGSPSLDLGNENHVGLISALASSCQSNDSQRIGVDESVDELGCERDSEMTPEMNIPFQVRDGAGEDNCVIIQNLNFELSSLNSGVQLQDGEQEFNLMVGQEGKGDSIICRDKSLFSKFEDNDAFSTPSFRNLVLNESSASTSLGSVLTESSGLLEPVDCEGANVIKKFAGHDNLGNILCPMFSDEEASGGLDSKKLIREKERWERYATRLRDRLRVDDVGLSSSPLPEGITLGDRILFDGVYIDKVTIFKKLIPPPRAKKSRLTFQYWKNLVGRPLLIKMREAGIDIDLNIYGDDSW